MTFLTQRPGMINEIAANVRIILQHILQRKNKSGFSDIRFFKDTKRN